MPAAAVKFRAVKCKALPKQPSEMNDAQWDLVKRMCAWEPLDRINISKAVNILKELMYEELGARWPQHKASQLGIVLEDDEPKSVAITNVKPSLLVNEDSQDANFAYDAKWREEAEQAIHDHKLVLRIEKQLKLLLEFCNLMHENELLCLHIHDRMNTIYEGLKRIDSSDGRFADTEVVSDSWSLVDAFCGFLRRLAAKLSDIVEQLIMQRKVFDEMERFHVEIDILCGRLNIDKTLDWKEQQELHQIDVAKRFRARVTKSDELLSNIGDWRDSLKQLEDEMILCQDLKHLPAMLFMRDAIELKFSSGFAVDICLLKATDLILVGKQKKMSDWFVVFRVGTEVQSSRLYDSYFSPICQRFRFLLQRKNVADLNVQVWAYGRQSEKEEARNDEALSTPQLIGTVSIPLPPLLFKNTSDEIAYPLKVPEALGKQKRQNMIHLELQYSDEDSLDELSPSEAERGCIVCGSPVPPGRLYCESCAGIFGQCMLTETLPIWYIPHQRITVDTSFQGMERESIKVFGGALEHDSSVDVWCLSPNKEYEREMLVHQIDLWFMLNHPHILRLFGACHTEHPILCVCEHGAYANIVDFMSKDSNKNYVWIVLYQVALGLSYLHSQRIVHGDVKCENIVLGIDGKTKLSNFGFTYRWRGTSLLHANARKKNIRWMAPERIYGDDMLEPMFESDIYELGMVIIEIVTGEDAWGLLTDDDIFESVSDKRESFALPDGLDAAVSNLVARMCEFDHKKRLNITAVVTELGKLAFFQSDGVVSSVAPIYTMEDALNLFKHPSHSHMKRYEHKTKVSIPIYEVSIPEHLRNLCLNMNENEIMPMCKSILLRLEEMQAKWKDVSLPKRKQVIACYTSMSADLCAYITKYGAAQPILRLLCGPKIAAVCHRIHCQLDHLLGVCDIEVTREWREIWKADNQARLDAIGSIVAQPNFLQSELQDTQVQNEALSVLFGQSASVTTEYSEIEQKLVTDTLKHIKSVSGSQSEAFPAWFVPPHEIKYNPTEMFAKGGYGSVHHGTWNGVDVMIKTPLCNDEHIRKTFMKETEIWFAMKNPHVVCLFCACHIGNPFFVCEKTTNGTLSEYAAKAESRSEVWKKLREAALGLQYIQKKNVVHQDIKSDNILIGADGKSKIADFGLSFHVNSENSLSITALDGIQSIPTTVDIGAVPWKAPEIIGGISSGSFASDIYSLGMCVLEVMNGYFPWGNTPDLTVKRKVALQKKLPKQPANMSEAQWALVQQMCAWQPKDRLSIDQVVEKLKDIARIGVPSLPGEEKRNGRDTTKERSGGGSEGN